MRLGFINLTDLALLLWKSNDHFKPLQDFLKDYLVTVYKEQHKVGVISGCAVTVTSGLEVQVAAGVVLFDNDELVKVEVLTETLDAADPTDPRLDRLELVHSVANNLQVTNTLSQVKQFDKLQTGTPTKNTGVAAPSPVLPAKTANTISLASISVAATQTVLAQSDISETEKVRDISRPVDNLTREEDILNTQAGTDLPGLLIDKTKHRMLIVEYHIKRKTDTGSSGVSVPGRMYLFVNPETNDVFRSDEQFGDDVSGVDFDVDATSGQVTYDSSTIAGANYVAKLKYSTTAFDI